MPRSLPTAALALLALAGACSGKPKAPPRETVLAPLQQEAAAVKKEMEKIDPALGVAVSWNLDAVEVKERPGDVDRPWSGSIRFKVESRTREPDGSTKAAQRQKTFDYLYDAQGKRWLMQYSPPTPAPAR